MKTYYILTLGVKDGSYYGYNFDTIEECYAIIDAFESIEKIENYTITSLLVLPGGKTHVQFEDACSNY